jgi:hypothetical protein
VQIVRAAARARASDAELTRAAGGGVHDRDGAPAGRVGAPARARPRKRDGGRVPVHVRPQGGREPVADRRALLVRARPRGAGDGAYGRAGTSSRTCRPSETPASPRSGSRTPGCASSRIRPRCRLRSSSRPGKGPCKWATGSPGSAPPFLRRALRARLLCLTTPQELGPRSTRKDRWNLGGRERVLICQPMLCQWIRLERGSTGLNRAALQLLAVIRARIRRCLGQVRYSTWHALLGLQCTNVKRRLDDWDAFFKDMTGDGFTQWGMS